MLASFPGCPGEQQYNPVLASFQAPLESSSAEYRIPELALFPGSPGEHQCRVQSLG